MKRQQISLCVVTLLISVFGACGSKDSSDPVKGSDAGLDAAEETSSAEAGKPNTRKSDAAAGESDKCGNGQLDPGEECDDSNGIQNDGCTLCAYDCAKDTDCTKQQDSCSGPMVCNAEHACEPGKNKLADGTTCKDNGVCRSGKCVTMVCGNKIVEKESGEECDDGNYNNNDGCTTKCTFTCVANDATRGCQNDCNPTVKCDEKNTCSGGAAVPDGTTCQAAKGLCQSGKCVIGAKTTDAGVIVDPNAVQAGGICDRMTTIQCSGEATCCTSPRIKFASYDECKTTMMAYCTNTLFVDKISLEKVIGFDAEFAKKAFGEFDSLAANCDPDVVFWGSSQDGLRGILKGTIAAGGDCTPASILQLEKVGAALFSCADGANYDCLPRTQGAWTCDRPSGIDAMCFSDVNCIQGLYCDNPQGLPGTGICKQRKENGSTCSLLNECTSLACRNGKCVVNDTQTAYCLRQ